jgi:kinesin family member 1
MEITSRVVTAVRIRPLSTSEDGYKKRIVTYVGGNPGQVILLDPCYYEKPATPRDRRISERSFQFDYSFNSLNFSDECSDSTQAGIYEKIGKPLIENVFDGFNCSLFAYGKRRQIDL